MDDLIKFLRKLDKIGIKLSVDNRRLKYNAPKGAMTEDIRSQLAERKEEIIRFFDDSGLSKEKMPNLIPKIERTKKHPLSFVQQMLWILDKLEGDKATYNIQMYYRLPDRIDISVIEKTLNEIIKRHEVLRTVFKEDEGELFQVILPEVKIEIPIIEIKGSSKEEIDDKAKETALKEIAMPFDLSNEPPIRVKLILSDKEPRILLLTMHHIASDGWSEVVFWNEFEILYEAFLKDEPSPLHNLDIQYVDFAHWQRNTFSDEALEPALDYWKKMLDDAPLLSTLPTDSPRQSVRSFKGTSIDFEIDEQLMNRLKKINRKSKGSFFAVIYAALAVFISRYNGREDIVIGSVFTIRDHKEIQDVMGCFINTLALRADLSGGLSFAEFLERVNDMILEAYKHKNLPFERLVNELGIERNTSFHPLFQIMLNFQNYSEQDSNNLGFSAFDFGYNITKFDMTFFIWAQQNGLKCKLEYNTALFDSETIKRIIENFKALLEGIASNPDEEISKLPIMTDEELYKILVEFNDTDADYPNAKCIHEIFEEQVIKTPAAPALIFENKILSYAELNRGANEIAHYLISKGAGPEKIVAVYMDRSFELIEGVIGILKAGSAYMPIDISFPKRRIADMLQDAKPLAILTKEKFLSMMPETESEKILIDKDIFESEEKYQNPASGVTPDNPCSLLYTSGSTGKSKGTIMLHKGLVNYTAWIAGKLKPGAGDGAPLISPLSFDISITSLFPPLVSGDKVALFEEGKEIDTLADSINKKSGFSIVKLTPTHLKMLSELCPNLSEAGAKAFVIGGEPLYYETIKPWLKFSPETLFMNHCAPTEATVGCCTLDIPRNISSEKDILPIGRPIANVKMYILDKNFQLLPIGVPGEIHISGPCLARGYLNRPELTKKKFISNPFSDDPKYSRLYKSGDFGRRLADGTIEVLGRTDFQVKIRGFRIELEEIEAVLSKYPNIKRGVVVVKEEPFGNKRLIAYITPDIEEAEIENIRLWLKERLPEYMIPEMFVILSSFPLTLSGKINKQALPAADISALQKEYTAPDSDTGKIIARIWSEVLGIERIGKYDNFFKTGGNSLLSVRVTSRVKERIGKNIPVSAVFEYPTVESLSRFIDKYKKEAFSPLVNLQSMGAKTPLFLFHYGNGEIFYFADLAKYLGTERPIYALRAFGLEHGTVPLKSIEEIAAKYIEAIRSVQPEGPYMIVGYCFGGIAAYEAVQQLISRKEKVKLLMLISTHAPHLYRIFAESITGDKESSNFFRFMWSLGELAKTDLLPFYSKIRKIAPDKDMTQKIIEDIKTLSKEKRFEYLWESIKEAGTKLMSDDIEYLKRVYKVLRQNSELETSYVPKPYAGRIILIKPAEDTERKSGYIKITKTIYGTSKFVEKAANAPYLGWDKYCTNIEAYKTEGNHYSIFKRPNVKKLAEKITNILV